MSKLDTNLEEFLAKVLDARKLGKARQACMDEDIHTMMDLECVRDELKDIFTKVAAKRISTALPGQFL